MSRTRVIVIGGGASGMMAAITAAKNGAEVTILEHMDRIGKKLLSTGNGRCNFTNTNQDISNYRGNDPEFAMSVINKFDYFKVLRYFSSLGIYAKDRNGYMYPYSDQASSVLDVLRFELKRLGVAVECGVRVFRAEKRNEEFIVYTANREYRCDNLIIACGSKAAPGTGSDGSGYELAKGFGHNIVPVVPALCALRSNEKYFKAISGVRTEAEVSLFVDNECVYTERGELQLTDYGISGIPVFQLSRFAAKALAEKKQVYASINLAPDMSRDALYMHMKNRFAAETIRRRTVEEGMTGLLNKKLVTQVVKLSGISLGYICSDVNENQLKKLVNIMNGLKVNISSTNSFDNAQVCAGGVDTAELTENLESVKCGGLYFAGEIIDVDGACGGYNLQWAWSSGFVAGSAAAVKRKIFNI